MLVEARNLVDIFAHFLHRRYHCDVPAVLLNEGKPRHMKEAISIRRIIHWFQAQYLYFYSNVDFNRFCTGNFVTVTIKLFICEILASFS